jgi:glycosyltransferase involved in cell wall biosynthesis
MQIVNFTVAIPTYNGAKTLPLVLERLRSQLDTDSISWEILVIDNNSNDDTALIVQTYQANWAYSPPLRYCFELKQGLAFARQCAIHETRGEWIAFLDDDNLPATNWVSAAFRFAKENPAVGAFGGKIRGLFETDPPPQLKPILFYLALVDRGLRPLQYHPKKNGVPPGAGLVVRKQAWLDWVPANLSLIGRVGSSMLPGEDAEALLHIYRGGWQIWYNPAMELEHIIPASRLEKSYFLPLMRGIGLCRHRLRMLVLKQWQRPFMFLFYLISDLLKVIIHWIHYQSSIETNLWVACERERLLGILISPFYLYQKRHNRDKYDS